MEQFAQRRERLKTRMGAKSALVLPGASQKLRNGDTHFLFRQDSFFYYLTGFTETPAWMVFVPEREEGEWILFNPPYDPHKVSWDGPMAGQEGAVQQWGADQSFPIEALPKELPTLLAGLDEIYYEWGADPSHDALFRRAIQKLKSQIRRGVNPPHVFHSAHALLSEMRVIKDEQEIALMQKAVDISTKAHVLAMQATRPGMYEYELEAVLRSAFTRDGARFEAYPAIVGTGANASYLHYVQNDARLQDGDLLLIDAGCEYQYYASDLTRTFPVNGRYSGRQKDLYECVLAAQMAGIAAIQPGQPWDAIQQAIVAVLVQGLVDLKLLKGSVSEAIAKENYKRFYMHSSGHWLGLDVHDVGMYHASGASRLLEPGMVLTVEPGIYITPAAGADPEWGTLGIRIEDDVLVTPSGHRVLSADLPKTVSDVETLMRERP